MSRIPPRLSSRPARRRWKAVASYGLSTALVAYLVARMDLSEAARVLAQARPGPLILAAAVVAVVPALCAVRWLGVLRAQPGLAFSWRTAFVATMIANALNSFVPSKAGDMAKALYVRRQAGFSSGVGTVALERLVDLFVVGVLGLVGYALTGLFWALGAALILCTGVVGAFVVVTVTPADRLPLRVALAAGEFTQVFHRWGRRPGCVALTVAGSAGAWGLMATAFYLVGVSMAPDLDAHLAVAVYPLGVIAGLMPVTISGIGTRDLAFATLLASALTPEQATCIALAYTVLAYWMVSVLALPFVFLELGRVRKGRLSGDSATKKRAGNDPKGSPPPV